jgi:hypothetical protein
MINKIIQNHKILITQNINLQSLLIIDYNNFHKLNVEFKWSVCGPNELGVKRYIHTYSDDLISIYVYILCIFRRYKRNTEENKK